MYITTLFYRKLNCDTRLIMWKPVVIFAATSVTVCSLIRYFSGGKCNCTARLDGLTILITGANSGLGKALAIEVAKRGAEVILACRDFKLGTLAQKEIILTSNNNKIHVRFIDLNSIESIVEFAKGIEKDFPELYAIVNNAGVFYYPQELTEDSFDVTFQTNYLGHFVLSHHLLKILKRSEHARIINVVSEAHNLVTETELLEITEHQQELRPPFIAYGASKLALLLFTRELSRRLLNTNIIVNAVNPGNVETAIYRYYPPLSNPILYALQWPVRLLVIKTPRQGAQTALHALLTPNRSTGQYMSDCKIVLPSVLARNNNLARDYYNLTLRLLDRKLDSESEC